MLASGVAISESMRLSWGPSLPDPFQKVPRHADDWIPDRYLAVLSLTLATNVAVVVDPSGLTLLSSGP
jgi:hypothetical protein